MALIDQQLPHPPPAITYGRMRNKDKNKLIPLAGNHFTRPVPYDIAPYGDDERQTVPRRVNWGKVYSAKEPNPDDSPLSEDELDAVYGLDANAKSSPPMSLSLPVSETSAGAHVGLSVSSVTPPSRRQIPQPTPRGRRMRPMSTEPVSAASKIDVDNHTPSKRSSPQRSPITRHAAINKKSAAKRTRRPLPLLPLSLTSPTALASVDTMTLAPVSTPLLKSAPRANVRPALRRLPVTELSLIQFPAETMKAEGAHDPSSPCVVEQQDPIEPSSTAVKRRASPISEDDVPQVKAPLTAIRKRLKASKFTHKSVIALCKKHDARQPFFRSASNITRKGDGFETSELKITQTATVVKERRSCKHLTLGSPALILRTGPLPDVEFIASSLELCVERPANGDAFLTDREGLAPAEGTLEAIVPAEQPSPGTTNVSDRVLDRMVAQRLSSVSAPKRAYSISSDDDDDDGRGDWSQSDEEVHDSSEARSSEIGRGRSMSQAPLRHSRASSAEQDSTSSCIAPQQPRNAGVTLDFRKLTTSDVTSKKCSKQRHLIEVDETIVDEPHFEECLALDKINGHGAIEPTVQVARFAEQETPVRMHRPRSILRHKASVIQDSDTRPEDTPSNTRRNSLRVIEESAYFGATVDSQGEEECDKEASCLAHNNEVDLDESRYFINALGMLRGQGQIHLRPRIIKQRSSEARRASYASQSEVPVPDSDAAVLETSTAFRERLLDPPDYTKFRKLDILKRTSDATWSSSLPKVSQDLSALTRTVSKEHGTLSQSVRRRPSLPFQSPVKKGRSFQAQ